MGEGDSKVASEARQPIQPKLTEENQEKQPGAQRKSKQIVNQFQMGLNGEKIIAAPSVATVKCKHESAQTGDETT